MSLAKRRVAESNSKSVVNETAKWASESETSGWSPVPRDDLVYSPLLKSRAPSHGLGVAILIYQNVGAGQPRAKADRTSKQVVEEACVTGGRPGQELG